MQQRSSGSETILVTIPILELDFKFAVLTRPLRLGSGEPIQYYWMDCYPDQEKKKSVGDNQGNNANVSARVLADNSRNNNCSMICSLYGATIISKGLERNPNYLVPFMMSHALSLFSKSKSLQDVYNDAYLRPGSVVKSIRNNDANLEPQELERIKKVINKKSFFGIQKELDEILGRFCPPKEVIDSNQDNFSRLIGTGPGLAVNEGINGLHKFRDNLIKFIEVNRKRGDNHITRDFLNLLVYNLKISFYSCCSNAWSHIIPWLKENRGLDSKSEGFLRFWHNQCPVYPLPMGTLIKNYYEIQVQNWEGPPGKTSRKSKLKSTSDKSEMEDPFEKRDYFNGQVLSMHPLSGVFMKDPAMLAFAGEFFCTEDYERTLGAGLPPDCESFWNLIGGILSCASIYRKLRDNYNSQRKKIPTTKNTESNVCKNFDKNIQEIFLKYIESNKMHCKSCNKNWHVKSFEKCNDEEVYYSVCLICKKCGSEKTIELDFNDLNMSK